MSRTEELFKAKDDVRTLTESCKEKDLALRVKETMLADHAITIQELKNKLHVADKEIKQLQRALEELQGTVEEVRLDNIELETGISILRLIIIHHLYHIFFVIYHLYHYYFRNSSEISSRKRDEATTRRNK